MTQYREQRRKVGYFENLDSQIFIQPSQSSSKSKANNASCVELPSNCRGKSKPECAVIFIPEDDSTEEAFNSRASFGSSFLFRTELGNKAGIMSPFCVELELTSISLSKDANTELA